MGQLFGKELTEKALCSKSHEPYMPHVWVWHVWTCGRKRRVEGKREKRRGRTHGGGEEEERVGRGVGEGRETGVGERGVEGKEGETGEGEWQEGEKGRGSGG